MTAAGYGLVVLAAAATAALIAVPAAAARRRRRRSLNAAVRALRQARAAHPAVELTDGQCDRILRMLRT